MPLIERQRRPTPLDEYDVVVAERDSALAARDVAIAERDEALARIDFMRNTRSWRITKPLRFAARLMRHGFDWRVLSSLHRPYGRSSLRIIYHRLPLPISAKLMLRRIYHGVSIRYSRSIRCAANVIRDFQPPRLIPAEQRADAPDYFIWGAIDWHFRHQRPQQLARELAASGRRVFYVSAHLTDAGHAGFELEALDAAGRLFQVKLFASGAPVIYHTAPAAHTIAQLRSSAAQVLGWADSRQIISLVQHPFWCEIGSVLPNSRLVYDCMDHHEGFGNNADSILSLEKKLARAAELAVFSSDFLEQHWAEYTGPRRDLVRNAADYPFFSQRPARVYRDSHGRRVIGYYGAIAEWFDVGLIAAVAKSFPECCVLLVGADTTNAGAQLRQHANIELVGEVPYAELPYYVHGFDICLLPFLINVLTLATNPVKVYEYLSAGKPVVSVDLPEMRHFGELVEVAKDRTEFLCAIAEVLDKPLSSSDQISRQAFAQEQTWAHRAERLMVLAETREFEPLVSIVVVTYNNLLLTQACLASIEACSDDAHLEIIVVDNASTDGTPEFLAQWAVVANRKIVLNDDNRGFAAANNQGLAIAGGEYLVLLNNDTEVTPGWLHTLKNHLRRDRRIGLIGPVTNNIGNEAKIPIAYTGTDEMHLVAAEFTREHMGDVFALRTLAFFCVMMPRSTYERIGSLDEAFGRGFFEDDDYCRRVEQSGLKIVCAKDVFVHHHLSASFNQMKCQERQALFDRNKAIYEAKWGRWIPHTYSDTGS